MSGGSGCGGVGVVGRDLLGWRDDPECDVEGRGKGTRGPKVSESTQLLQSRIYLQPLDDQINLIPFSVVCDDLKIR